MFGSVEDAVRAHREAAVEHHRARDRHDPAGMDAAVVRIREVTHHLRGRGRPDLVQPLTMEWVTRGRDAQEHARHRRTVEELVRGPAVSR